MEIIHRSLLITLCIGVQWSTSENLHRQKRWLVSSFSIDEGYKGEYPFSLGHVKVADEVVIFRIHGQGVDEEPRNVLEIIEDTGELWVLRPVDYEQFQKLTLTFQAYNKVENTINTQLSLLVNIRDTNDCAPTFDQEKYEISVEESTPQGSELISVKATDNDVTDEFKKFELRIVSVSPQQRDVEFYLTQFPKEIGTISFKGCLDHEKAARYTIIVEAKNPGQQDLSSSCTIVLNIEDQNNHFPVMAQPKAVVRVKEDQENVLLLRVPVTDEDVKDTPSWRTKFHIQDDTDGYFNITTDPKTNEGLLSVIKSLNYEDTPVKNITVIAENEVPFYTCKVLERSAKGLWKVAFSGGTDRKLPAPPQSKQNVTVFVENVNEAPIFDMPQQSVWVMENAAVGTYLKTFSARDPDVMSNDKIIYKIGKDPAGWVTVDAKTGNVTTTKIVDRESSFVDNGVYVATIQAADDGKPPMTATATLSILISDINDNTPILASNKIDFCHSDKPSLARVEASDLDGEPNGGPFTFKLLGDVKDKWRVDPSHGFSVNLVKESIVHSGHYDLMLEVADLQGSTVVQNLSVTVCTCTNPIKTDCSLRKSAVSSAAGATVGIVLLSLLLFGVFFLLVFFFSCEVDKIPLEDENLNSGILMISNIEYSGTDCEVEFNNGIKWNQIQTTSQVEVAAANPMYKNTMQSPLSQTELLLKQPKNTQWMGTFLEDSVDSAQYTQFQGETFSFPSSMHMSTGATSNAGRTLQRTASSYMIGRKLRLALETMVNKQRETESNNLDDYEPHKYAEEGDSKHNFELDAISISEVGFDHDLELDFKFSTLASICMPNGSVAHHTKPSD
ncbi:unnamed protein product [Ophioblennius macclurei]